ncbi:MAG TPA: 50S ribosomal protein L25 [Firmicutes bacterium]|jgi:large subunit ribosomal protein L25|nr:50S ribosomal protein L25 [Bacillota bacterium]
MERVQLAAIKRDTGKTSARRLREQGYLPAVLYGQDVDSLPLAVKERDLSQALKLAGRNSLINLQFPGAQDTTVMIKDLQQDRLRNRFVHVDFLKISLKDRIQTEVWLQVVGEEAISKQGLLLQQQIRAVLVECLPTEIPNAIEVNVADLTAGDSVTVGQLQVPEGVTVLADPDEVICSVIVPRVETVEDEPEAGEEAEGQEAAETPDSEEK